MCSLFSDCKGLYAGSWSPHVRWMWEGLCNFPRCAPVASGSIRKADFESRLQLIWEQDVVEANKAFLKEMAALTLIIRINSWTVPPRMVTVKTIPVLTMYLLGNVYKDETWFAKKRHIHVSQLSDMWWGRFYSIIVKTLLRLHTSAHGTTVKCQRVFILMLSWARLPLGQMQNARWSGNTMAPWSMQN